jgi:hypothetical protein
LLTQQFAVGQDLPGFDGVIHINPDNDLVILNNIKDAYSTEGIMKAVKNVLVTSDRGLVDRRHRMDLDFAKAIHKMFPDLTILFVANHVGSYIKCYIKNPDAFKLVPTEAVRNSNYAFNPAVWPRVWTKMQVELGIDTACPELKVMKVVKRTEARGYMYGNAG